MDISDYQSLAARTIPDGVSENELLTNFCFGLVGEAGELIDHIKKVLYHGHKPDIAYIKKELGDQLWYLSGLASVLCIPLDEVAIENINKLKKRYPQGFSFESSVNRKE